MFTQRPAHRAATALAVALTVALAACGDDADDGDTAEATDSTSIATAVPATEVDAPAESVPDTTSTSVDESGPASDTAPNGTDLASPSREEVEVLSVPAGPAEFPVLGGIQFELPEASRVIQGTGCILIEQPGYTGGSPYGPNVKLAGVVATGGTTPVPISTIDEWLALYEGQPEPTPNGETLNVLGLELQGYSIDGAFLAPPPDDRWLNCTANPGAVSALVFLPSGHEEVYLAETDDALVVIGAGGYTEDEYEEVRPMFDQIVSTLQSTET